MTECIRIPNIQNYTLEIINDELILNPKKNYITENELNITDIKYSTILQCMIKIGETTISTNIKYQSILSDIWKSMKRNKILQTTTFNVKKTNTVGYRWHPDINISYQNKDAKGTLKEILNMIKVNKYNINISIKLKTGRIIYFKIE